MHLFYAHSASPPVTVCHAGSVSLFCQVKLLQISIPSLTNVKEYQDLKVEVDQLVGCINGRFTTHSWSPIRYIYGCVSQDELAGFYRDAAVALVTPLRDGMTALFLMFRPYDYRRLQFWTLL
jgi:trehalose-6-phosphate synthase